MSSLQDKIASIRKQASDLRALAADVDKVEKIASLTPDTSTESLKQLYKDVQFTNISAVLRQDEGVK